jgi:hypothetical protein
MHIRSNVSHRPGNILYISLSKITVKKIISWDIIQINSRSYIMVVLCYKNCIDTLFTTNI